MSIAAVMTLYNEELLVDLAIKSAKDFVDEFVIVDNGCTDRTMEVAEECAGKWKLKARFFKFDGNLRQSRYFSFNQCKTDWIFIQDGDHILQTDGPHSMAILRELESEAKFLTYRFPLVRLFFDYEHVEVLIRGRSRRANQNPHKLFFRNKPKMWCGNHWPRHRDIPDSLAREEYLFGNWGVWNLCIKNIPRIYQRQWALWIHKRHWGEVPAPEYPQLVADKQGFDIEDFDAEAHDFVTNVMKTRMGPHSRHQIIHLATDTMPEYGVSYLEHYCGYPAVIQEEVDHGVIRSSFDTVDTIRKQRLKAGLSEI